ncbi:MAG TPA: glycosyltransferase [Terriglobales bacterium]|nr:glycosyltransferase [Terriglobales bacterium]
MKWLVVMPYTRPGTMGPDFADELTALGHTVTQFAYRRDNVLYKNKPAKALYQQAISRRLARVARQLRPDVVLVIKGAALDADVIRRIKATTRAATLNFFPDNPLWMMPFDRIEAYDLFFTKERYALRQLELVGARNLAYLPMYCMPSLHHPVAVAPDQAAALRGVVALVGARYPYRERLVRELADFPLRVWGPGWRRAGAPVAAHVAGGFLDGRAKLAVYCGATLSLNPHHPMNDIVGVNTRAFELAAAGACQVVDLKEELPHLFKPGEEIVAYRDLPELRRQLAYHLAHPDEARAIGENARRRALAEHTLRHRVEEMIATVHDRLGRR